MRSGHESSGRLEKGFETGTEDLLIYDQASTSYRSPQLTLWTLGPNEWLLFKKVPDYTPRTRRKKVDVIQLPFPDIDESQQPAVSSS